MANKKPNTKFKCCSSQKLKLYSFSHTNTEFVCTSCKKKFKRKTTAEEREAHSKLFADQMALISNSHRVWFSYKEAVDLKEDPFDKKESASKWARESKTSGVDIVSVNDITNSSSEVILIPHFPFQQGEEGSVTLVFVPQTDEEQLAHILLSKHDLSELIKALTKMQRVVGDSRHAPEKLPDIKIKP